MQTYRILVMAVDSANPGIGELASIYQTDDPFLALAAGKQMVRLLASYDRRLSAPKFFPPAPEPAPEPEPGVITVGKVTARPMPKRDDLDVRPPSMS